MLYYNDDFSGFEILVADFNKDYPRGAYPPCFCLLDGPGPKEDLVIVPDSTDEEIEEDNEYPLTQRTPQPVKYLRDTRVDDFYNLAIGTIFKFDATYRQMEEEKTNEIALKLVGTINEHEQKEIDGCYRYGLMFECQSEFAVVGHTQITKGERVHLEICFDLENDRVGYYETDWACIIWTPMTLVSN